eukprot:6208475-Pleurochrysis_carterae.AAC.4
MPCDHELWAITPLMLSYEALMKQRDDFLNQLSQEERGQTVYNTLQFESLVSGLQESDVKQKAPVRFIMVGSNSGCQRAVCKCVLLAHYPLSPATLNRINGNKRQAYGATTSTAPRRLRQHRLHSIVDGQAQIRKRIFQATQHMSTYVITRWLKYAEETSEKLPNIFTTPHLRASSLF